MVLFVTYQRNTIEESEHHGYLVIRDQNQTKFVADHVCCLRSAAKPLQLLAMLNNPKTINQINPTEEEIAIATASHSGTDYHVSIVDNLLRKHGLTRSMLRCKGHIPIDPEAQENFIKESRPLSDVYNNCSGQHAFMLAYCHYNNWPLENYYDMNHPLQKLITGYISSLTGQDVILGIDGCGVPSYALPLTDIASIYTRLIQAQVPAFQYLINSVFKYPIAFGGHGRVDTNIIMGSKQTLFAKVGAAGMIIIFKLDGSGAIALKLADGNNKVRDIYIIQLLHQLHWLSETQWAQLMFKPYQDLTIRTLNDLHAGEIKLNFSFI